MLEWYHVTLIIMALAAGIAAWDVPRAVLWICLGALSYATSAWWHNMGFPYATLYGACTNFAICVLLAWLATTKYELWVFNAFILMLVIDALFVAGFIGSRFAFAVSLEIVNAAAMLLIMATGVSDRIARHEGQSVGDHHPGIAHLCNRALLAERTTHHEKWWRN